MCCDEQTGREIKTREEFDLCLEIAKVSAELGENIDPQLHHLMRAIDDTGDNANRYVPWSDPQIPFECVCGEIIYADTVHTHEGDEPFINRSARWYQKRDELLRELGFGD